MPENPRLLSLGMNGILSERSGGLFRHTLAWPKVMTGMPAGLKPWALVQGVVHSDNRCVLHSNREESRENSLDRRPFFIEFFESLTYIVDAFADARSQAN